MSPRAFHHPGEVEPTTGIGDPIATSGRLPTGAYSDLADLACLQALLALLRLELHTLALRKVAEALHLDLRLVDEEVIPAAVRRDKSKALFGVEPLDCTYTHNCHSLNITH